MLDHPPLFNGEILYSMIIRYHRFSGNTELKDSITDFYGKEKGLYSLLFPNEVSLVLENLNISNQRYIEEHSVFPFYRLFMTNEKYTLATERMLFTDKIYANYLRSANTCDDYNSYIKYCPLCIMENNGDIIINRNNQIDIVQVCHIHKCYLNYFFRKNRRQFETITKMELDLNVKFPDKIEKGTEYKIASDINYLLNTKQSVEISQLRVALRERIHELGYFERGHWFQSANDVLKNYFYQNENVKPEVIEKLSFERLAGIRKPKGIHPLEYILLIMFLYGNTENLIIEIEKKSNC